MRGLFVKIFRTKASTALVCSEQNLNKDNRN